MLYALLCLLTTAWTVAGTLAVLWVRRRPVVSNDVLSPVSVLKPLSGVDSNLEANLRSFFEQDHPRYELIFGVEGKHDPAVEIVRRLMKAYAHVPARLVVHHGGAGINPKVRNLRAMLTAVRYDVLLISDSNVVAPPGYLRGMASQLQDRGVGVVTSLIGGTGERSLGATLENLHLNGEVAAGVALPVELLGHPVVVGKSMMLRRSVLNRLGGFESVANVLAEDYVIGRMFSAAGYATRLERLPIHNVNVHTTVHAFFLRHVRWAMIRLRMNPSVFLLEPLTKPLFVALLAPLFGASLGLPLLWAAVLTASRDVAQWIALRGPPGLLCALPLSPLRDLLILLAWCAAPFHRHVTWRGHRVLVGPGTRLYAEHEVRGPSLLPTNDPL